MNIVLFRGRPVCVNFSSHPGVFHISPVICTNPQCTDCHVTLQFAEVDERLAPRKRGTSFPLKLNLDTGKEEGLRELPGAIQDMVVEFVRELTPAMFQSIKDMVSSKRARNRAIQDYMIDFDTLKAGALVPFTDIVSGEKSVASGGTSCRFTIQHEGTGYYIEDLYCPRPACACNNAHLLFFEGTPDSDGISTELTDFFMARVPFRGKIEIEQIMKYTMEKAVKIVKQFFRRYPDAMEEFKENYKIVKDIGKRSMAASRQIQPEVKVNLPVPQPEAKVNPPARQPETKAGRPEMKVGRNAPCPCGSGKKYKKCCGV